MGRERQRRYEMTTATKDLETLSERDQRIVNELLKGETRAVVAERHNLTPERVRQISAPFLADIKDSRDSVRLEVKEQRRKERLAEVKALAEKDPSMRVSAIATAVGGDITSQDVIAVLGEKESLRRDQIRFVEDPVFTRKFNDEDCFEALRKASKRVGKNDEYGVLTMDLYSEKADDEDPKRSTIQKRFGTWQTACELAGVPSGDPIPRRVYVKKWTHEDMVKIVEQFFADKGVFGSMRQYAEWARDVPNTPTLATVRSHFGSWTKVKEIAAKMAK